MRAVFTRQHFALAVACAVAFGLLSEMASAQLRQDEHAIEGRVVVDFLR